MEAANFLQGIRTMTTAGDVLTQIGMAAHAYVFNADMIDDYAFDTDGELLVVPQQGSLCIFTELGIIEVAPSEICVIPRGLIFKIIRLGEAKDWRGYICENYGAKFTLPNRGPIGANCLANARDFKTPVAAFEDKETPCRVHVKWCGRFHMTEIDHGPLDVVAWHGNYAPYKYDLNTFSPVGAVLFDHPDPSIFTVLTAPSGEEGTANVDFVLFPPRWQVAEHTFRPPWYHRNIMSEFMGLIHGRYDAKEVGFVPGAMSLHNMMLPHGPDAMGFEKASNAGLQPVKLDNTLAFMFETRLPQQVTRYAAELETLQDDYLECWDGLTRKFDGTPGIK
jgi:homogentisate 1,2-dioxygenase